MCLCNCWCVCASVCSCQCLYVCMCFLHGSPSHSGSDPAEKFRYCPDASFRDLISPWISFPSRLRASIFISSTDLGKMMKGWLFSHLLFPAKVACISMQRKSAKTCKHIPFPFGYDQFHVISIMPCPKKKKRERPRAIIVIIQYVSVRVFSGLLLRTVYKSFSL